MNELQWIEEPISSRHDRANFDCGEPVLNDFFSKHARQSHDRGVSKTFVAILADDNHAIIGFYSLCPASLEFARTPEILRKKVAKARCASFQARSSCGQCRVSRARPRRPVADLSL